MCLCEFTIASITLRVSAYLRVAFESDRLIGNLLLNVLLISLRKTASIPKSLALVSRINGIEQFGNDSVTISQNSNFKLVNAYLHN